MVISSNTFLMVEQASTNYSHQCLCPQGELQSLLASLGGSPKAEVSLSQSPFTLLSLTCVLNHLRLCVHSLKVTSLDPPPLWISLPRSKTH